MDLSAFNSRQRPACPCCIFLKEDLFLPPSPGDPTENTAILPVDVVSPQDALRCIRRHSQELQQKQQSKGKNKPPILLVDTHNHAHLRRERHDSYMVTKEEEEDTAMNPLAVVSLSLAVEPTDWDDALKYSAAQSPQDKNEADLTLMGLGIHPWYISDTVEPSGSWKLRLEELLQKHPSAVVGEIGLCKMARCARTHPKGKTRGFEIQRAVLEEQIQVAVRYCRPVSIHCVQQHGVFLEILQDILEKSKEESASNGSRLVPPSMAMHSFTGTAHHIKQLLQWEASLYGEGPNDKKKKKDKSNQSTVTHPPLLYFGFSHIVNYEMCTSDKARRQGREAVRAVPLNRLLAESDVHHPEDVPAGTAGAIAYIAWALEQPIPIVAEITAKNGLAFLQSHLVPIKSTTM